MIRHTINITVLAVSLLLGCALVAMWVWSAGHEVLISQASSGTYRELRTGGGRWSYIEASSVPDDAPLAWDWDLERVPLPPRRSGEVLAGRNAAALMLTAPTRGGVWPVEHTSGRMNIGYSGVRLNRPLVVGSSVGPTGTGLVVTQLKIPATQSSIAMESTAPTTMAAKAQATPTTLRLALPTTFPSATPTITLPSLTRAPTSAPAALEAFTFKSLELTLTPPPPTAPPMRGVTASGTITISGGAVLSFNTGYPYERYTFPQWPPIVLALLPAMVILLTALRRRYRAHVRRRNHLCLTCGYDLRGGGEICPECGAAATTTTASSTTTAA